MISGAVRSMASSVDTPTGTAAISSQSGSDLPAAVGAGISPRTTAKVQAAACGTAQPAISSRQARLVSLVWADRRGSGNAAVAPVAIEA